MTGIDDTENEGAYGGCWYGYEEAGSIRLAKVLAKKGLMRAAGSHSKPSDEAAEACPIPETSDEGRPHHRGSESPYTTEEVNAPAPPMAVKAPAPAPPMVVKATAPRMEVKAPPPMEVSTSTSGGGSAPFQCQTAGCLFQEYGSMSCHHCCWQCKTFSETGRPSRTGRYHGVYCQQIIWAATAPTDNAAAATATIRLPAIRLGEQLLHKRKLSSSASSGSGGPDASSGSGQHIDTPPYTPRYRNYHEHE
jgi:hypothetical protein